MGQRLGRRIADSARTRGMPLTRANEGYAFREDGIHFLMRDGREEVVCRIIIEALFQLGRTLALTELTEVFETGREIIERAAGNKYDRTTRRPYEVLTITTDDLDLGDA
jgi:Protein of unknown function (DUF1488)